MVAERGDFFDRSPDFLGDFQLLSAVRRLFLVFLSCAALPDARVLPNRFGHLMML